MTVNIKKTYQELDQTNTFTKITNLTILPSQHVALPIQTQLTPDIFIERLQNITNTAIYYRIKYNSTIKILKIFRQTQNISILERKENAFLLLLQKLNYQQIPHFTQINLLTIPSTVYEQFDFSLHQIINLKPLPIQQIKVYIQQCAQILQSARQFQFYSGCFHSRKIHLKHSNPAQLLFTDFETAVKLQGIEKFIDFSTSKISPYLTENQGENESIQLEIRCPECVFQTAAIPAFADNFELGTLIFELWTGNELFRAENEFQRVKMFIQVLGVPEGREGNSKYFEKFGLDFYIQFRSQLDKLGFNENSKFLPIVEVLIQKTVYDDMAIGKKLLKELMRSKYYSNCIGNDEVEQLAIFKLVWGLIQINVNKRYQLEEIIEWIKGNLV